MSGFLDSGLIEGGAGYQIQRSLRLRASATAYMSRMFAAGNQTMWTYSVWLKRGTLGVEQSIFMTNPSGTVNLVFHADNCLDFYQYAGGYQLQKYTSKVYRDPTAWFHLQVVYDSGNATATDRIRIYDNGTRITAFSTTIDPSLNYTSYLNGAAAHYLGNYPSANFDGFRAEENFIGGQALTHSSFGQIDAITGQWTAKKYVGSYGTNGFYLPFTDTTSPTTLCNDASGNGNHWTPNNISTTAGATYDSMTDVPLSYGTVDRGNFAVMNPLSKWSDVPMDRGNLQVGPGPTGVRSYMSTVAMQQKTYAEVELTLVDSGNNAFGISLEGVDNRSCYISGQWLTRAQEGNFYASGSTNPVGPFGAISQGSIGRIAYDPATGKLWLGAGASWFNSGDPAAGTGAVATVNSSLAYFLSGATYNDTQNWNFGQRPFTYTLPTGFLALHTGNLTSDTVTVSGSFTGNLSTDGPCIWLNGAPETLTINGNAVTWGTHADKLASGFKLRSSSASYNASGTNTWTATILSPSIKSSFRNQLAKAN